MLINRRNVLGLGLGVLAVTAVAGCAEPQSAPPGQRGSGDAGGGGQTVRIGVGGQTLLTYFPVTLADRLGLFDEAGVTVELQDLQGGSKALTAMIGGSTDVTCGYYEHTIQMQAKNQPIVAFTDIGLSSNVALVIAPKNADTIKGVQDLKGKNVGVTAPGSSTDMYLKYLLNKEGMGLNDAAVSGIGAGAGAVAAVENGQVDAAVMLEPDISVLEKRVGTLPVFHDLRTPEGVQELYGAEAWPSACLYAKREWLDANEDTARKMAAAMVKTLAWIQEHSAEEIAQEMPQEFAAGDPEQYAKVLEEIRHTMSPDGRFSEEGVNAVLETQRIANPEVGDKKIDLTKTYTNDYLA